MTAPSRLADDQAVALRRPSKRAIAANQADAEAPLARQQLDGGLAEPTLIKDERSNRPGADCWRNGACGWSPRWRGIRWRRCGSWLSRRLPSIPCVIRC